MVMRRLVGVMAVLVMTLTQAQGYRVKRMVPMPAYGSMVKKMQKMSMGEPDPKVGEMVNTMMNSSGTNTMNAEELGTYFEGDMLQPMRRSDVIPDTKFQFRWSNGVVPYRFDGDFSAKDRSTILAAMAQFPAVVCVQFVPHSGEKDYLSIENKNTGCWSGLGRMGGKQVLNLQTPGCTYTVGTPIHEMMHALGIFHEQSRSDRDNFVIVQWGNIAAGKEHNFQQHKYQGFGVPYDYGSVMHYSLTAFTRNRLPTMTPRIRNSANIGQRNGFSASDIAKIRRLYGCDELPDINTNLIPPVNPAIYNRNKPYLPAVPNRIPNGFFKPSYPDPNYFSPDKTATEEPSKWKKLFG